MGGECPRKALSSVKGRPKESTSTGSVVQPAGGGGRSRLGPGESVWSHRNVKCDEFLGGGGGERGIHSAYVFLYPDTDSVSEGTSRVCSIPIPC